MKKEEARQAAREEATQVAVPAPEPALAPSFDPEGGTGHRYRFLESNRGFLVRCGPRRWMPRAPKRLNPPTHEAINLEP
jgi:Translocase of chloroplast 159/132, membrane anchor domain